MVAQQLQDVLEEDELDEEEEEEDGDIEADIAELDEKINLLTRCSAQLENERDIVVAEKVWLIV